MEGHKSFLGRGWSFPPAFSASAEGVEMIEDQQDIEQSLEVLLSTSIGERIMQPDYGCNLQELQFEPINSSMLGYMRDVVSDALLYHEPRIELLNLKITESDSAEAIGGKVLISIDYKIRGTNSRFNYVYPFYVKEAVD
jgi:uncharacterized protein